MNGQISIFDGAMPFRIDKPIRLIELFAGYGSQSLALEYLGVHFEHHRICEWAVPSIKAYRDLHMPNDSTDYAGCMSKDELLDFLVDKCVSIDYNTPATRDQLKRRKDLASIYNAIKSTNNLVSVTKAKGGDFGVTETDKYTYIMTYSFPCQDLSLAGNQAGMAKGSGTRSGLLWEVERILKEMEEKPQVLLMENVPQVCGNKNLSDFGAWITFLDSLGYKSFHKIINAKNFQIPQNRERCFMVSILGDYFYEFPEDIGLDIRLRDILGKNVPEQYYISEKAMQSLTERLNLQSINVDREISNAIRCGGRGSLDDKHGWDIVVEQGKDGEFDGNAVIDFYNGNIKDSVAGTLSTNGGHTQCGVFGVFEYKPGFRIRKLTEGECFKLMGVKTEDFKRIRDNASKSLCYHMAGDSIVTTCLMAIFGEMLGIDYESKIKELQEELKTK